MTTYKYNTLSFNKLSRKRSDLLYDKFLKFLTINLNKIHSEKFQESEWEIFLGHWLKYFSNNIVNYYYNNQSNKKYYKKSSKILISNNLKEYISLCSDEEWINQFKYLINQIKKNKKIFIKKIYLKKFHKNETNLFSKSKIIIKKIYFKIFKKFIIKNKILIYNTYLGKLNDIKLQLKFNQIPIIDLPINYKRSNINKKLRDKILNNKNYKINNFSKFYELLILNLPKIYLEDYYNLKNFIRKNYPTKTKIIFNSNEIITDDVFKYWCMCQKRKKSKIFLFEHGLNYGIVNNFYPQSFPLEKKYINTIFTWGNLKNNKKYKPMFTTSTKKFDIQSKKKLILIYNQCIPNYHYSSNDLNFNNFQIKNLYKNLKSNIQKNIIFRLHKTNFFPFNTTKIKKKLILETKNKNLNIDDGKKKLSKLIKISNLLIFTYPSTGFFEAIFNDIPCMLFWKNFKFEVDIVSKKNFQILKKHGILLTDEKKLAKEINKIFNNVDLWWYKKKRQNQILKFKNKFISKYTGLNKIFLELNKNL